MRKKDAIPGTRRPRRLSLKSQLAELEKTELVHRATDSELSYIFKHALTQETAYESLLHKSQREMHLHVAQAYEELYADRLDAYAALLAQHYAEAKDDAKTLEYSIRAGKAAMRVYANAEAITHYSRALEISKRAAHLASASQVRDIYISRGRALELSGRFDAALKNYEEAESLAIERGDRTVQLAALVALATIHSTPTTIFDAAHGRTLSNLALGLARELGDRPSEARVLWNLMLLSNFSGNLRDAVAYGEQSLVISRELGHREQIAYTLNDLFRSYVSTGQYERARAVVEESREFWSESGNQPMLADNLSRSARILFAFGEFDRAIQFSDEARQISLAIGNLWGQSFCRMFVGYIFIERGEIVRAIETMEECIRLADESGFMMAQVATRADLGWLYGTLGAMDHGIELAQIGRARAEQRLPSFKPWAFAALTRLYVMKGDLESAETSLKQGYECLGEDLAQHAQIEMPLADAELALVKRDYARAIQVTNDLYTRLCALGIRPFRSDALFLSGAALFARGEAVRAHEILLQARKQAEEIGSRRMLWQILSALGEIERTLGNAAQAQAFTMQARAIVEFIAQHTPLDLRAAFLNRQMVKTLLA